MTRALEFSSRVTNGKLDPKVSEKIAALLRTFEGKTVVISVAERKQSRSLRANKYLWSAVYPPIVQMFREHGNMVDVQDVHEFCKEHVGKLKQVIITPDGEIIRSLGSTTKLTNREYSDYIEAIRAWAAPFGCAIPDPNQLNQQEPANG